jgi:transposase
MSEAHAMVSLVELGWADQNDVAKALGYSARTLRRYQQCFAEGGLAALEHPNGYPPGRVRLAASRQNRIQHLKTQGYSHYEIARQLGVSVRAIRKTLRRLNWKPEALAHTELPLSLPSAALTLPPVLPPSAQSSPPGGEDPNLSAFCSQAETTALSSHDTDPSDRGADRLLARLGLLEDALPLFGSAAAVPRAGVLLALPALVASGVFECAQKIYGTLDPAFYGLRTSLLTLLLMALWRIKRPEGLKEYSPQDLGRVLYIKHDVRLRIVATLRANPVRSIVRRTGPAACRSRLFGGVARGQRRHQPGTGRGSDGLLRPCSQGRIAHRPGRAHPLALHEHAFCSRQGRSRGFASLLSTARAMEHGLSPFGRANVHARRNPLDRQSGFIP